MGWSQWQAVRLAQPRVVAGLELCFYQLRRRLAENIRESYYYSLCLYQLRRRLAENIRGSYHDDSFK